MPYIPQWKRAELDFEVDNLADRIGPDPGAFNYVVTQLARRQLISMGGNYAALRGVVGDLEAVKLEFYRRAAAPYEDQKVRENGDVY